MYLFFRVIFNQKPLKWRSLSDDVILLAWAEHLLTPPLRQSAASSTSEPNAYFRSINLQQQQQEPQPKPHPLFFSSDISFTPEMRHHANSNPIHKLS